MAKKKETHEGNKFPKEKIASSKRYKDKVDLVNALLSDDKEYSLEEVDYIINNFMKGKVD
jgi:hypothetical protein